ncbi:TonB-dependent receptor family protein [Paracrocinitomix mangrovi]|uniref:TonB-dependent receptor n=1 Tax=Paracrocinitomix mangrovi TaxID=2862509 RepID=UPI001C8ED174|nr:TonB-dependent receptor [Paracrocinitomix mangrovi]UKN03750.1 TonB-dependent receptor family protein [Paracrocinitomix mangrovi]
MKKLGLFILLAIGFATGSLAQTISIKGSVRSFEGDSLTGASVMLIGAQDSILKTYSITNKKGDFTLSGVKVGDYVLKASFFGYLPFEQGISITAESKDMELNPLVLQPKMLDGVVVDANYVPLQIKGDTIEYDSRAFEVKEHDVVEDLLKQLPGVEVAEDGGIKVQGKDVQQVLVDGEKFFGDDATIATKNLPANSVAKVQVFDKKSESSEFTGVDDGSESTTINIKLKDSHKKGYFGNIATAGGTQLPVNNNPPRYEAKGNIFMFKKKWQVSLIGMSNNVNQTGFTYSDYSNFMGGAQTMRRGGGDLGGLSLSNGDPDDGFLNTNATGVNISYKPSKKTTFSSSFFFNKFDKTFNKSLYRETYFTDSTLITDESADQNSNSYNGRADILFEKKIDSTHMLTVKLNGNVGQTIYDNANLTDNFTDDNQLVSAFNTGLNQTDFNYTFTGSADYRKKFLKDGRYTGIDVSYDRTNKDLTTYLDYLNTLVTNGVSVETATSQDQLSIQTTDNFNALWTWSEPLSLRHLMQVDLSVDRNGESRNRTVYDNVSDQQTLNTILSGDGAYHRMHYNGELRHKYFGKKINTTIGAQYKYLNLAGVDLFTAPREFHYILPSARFEWDPNKKTNMRLRYSTSITAPTLNQLQPLQDNTNPSQVILGNTSLSPEYKHTVNLRMMNFNQFNFSFFMFNISGGYTQNNIIYSQQVNEYYITELVPENIGDEKSLNAFVMYGTSIHPIKTKFRLHTNGGVSNGLVNLNGLQDAYTTYTFSPSLTIENIGKKVMDLRGGVAYNYSKNTYKDNQSFNNDYQNVNYYLNFTFNIKDRWEINPKYQHYFYPDFATNNQVMLLDFTVACNFLKSRKLQVYATAKDLLNQNTGLNQYYLQNIYEREVTQTLGRYVMLGVKYSFQNLGDKGDKAEEKKKDQ